jgi:Ca2+-binding RTX toxin-like protein
MHRSSRQRKAPGPSIQLRHRFVGGHPHLVVKLTAGWNSNYQLWENIAMSRTTRRVIGLAALAGVALASAAPGAAVETLRTIDDADLTAINLAGNATINDIIGNAGNNVINGGNGNDELIGRAGQDSFLFDSPLNAASNIDHVTDFSVADDTILLDQTIFSSSLGLGNISAGELVIGTVAQDADDRLIYDSTTGALFYDNDGNGGNAQVQFATLGTGLALTNLDFFVVA